MEETLAVPPTPAESAELEAAVDQIILEVRRTNERMKQIQKRTERLGVETRAMLALLKTG